MTKPTELTPTQRATKVVEVARRFAKKIVETHTTEEFNSIVAANAAEVDSSTSYSHVTNTSICHSHDFCDANELMLLAYCEIMGLTEDEFDLSDDGVMDLINEAWAIAKSRSFDL